jgi:hypothetical protein
VGKKKEKQKKSDNQVTRLELALKSAVKAVKEADTRTVAALENFHQALNKEIDGLDDRRHAALVKDAKKVKLALRDIIEQKKGAGNAPVTRVAEAPAVLPKPFAIAAE